ncbi:MAG: Nramp family divalent metal transporter [Acidobacteriota bacterium]|nr:Nramp family divalent metal transporter [Acidobacteriota bacterium]
MAEKKRWALLAGVGPGIMVAATGVGAGDVVTAAVAGARYGSLILWAALLGALVKWSLNEGLARWQLATGTTLLEGWMRHMPRFVTLYFLVYLVFWSFIVGGALMAACGLAGHALIPQLPVAAWGIIHSLAAAALVLTGRYSLMENLMKWFIGLMFTVVVVCAVLVAPPLPQLIRGALVPVVPEGSATWLLGVIGGVGGTVTVLSYGYWIREKGWRGADDFPRARVDLSVAYVLTGLFGVAIMVVTAGVQVEQVSGTQMALAVATQLGAVLGPLGKWAFLIGFWAAVFSSMVGVWQGVPYLFADYCGQAHDPEEVPTVDPKGAAYRGFLAFLALPPAILLFFSRPVWIVKAYAVAGAFFMPFLAVLLLVMNNRKTWVGRHRNGWLANTLLIIALALFGTLLVIEVQRRFL